jgi:hypothetical protein
VALETFRKGMKLERTLEEGIQKKWKAEEAQWNLLPGIGCQIHNHPFRSPYPQFDFPLINPEWGIADVRTTPFQVQFKTRYALEASVARLTSGASLLRHSDKTWNAFWHR